MPARRPRSSAEIAPRAETAVANTDDVSDWEGAARLVAQAVDEFGRLDVLINNAGILRDRMLVNLSEDEWDVVIRVNVPAPARQKKSPPDQSGCDFRQLGVRVPAVVVSPWIPKGTVDHTQYDHTSVLRTIENLFGISSLTARDAAADDVLALLSMPAMRTDCMTTLPDPVPDTPPSAPLVAAMAPAPAADEPLPQTGNIHGFIALAAKAHLEMAEGDPVATDAVHQTLTGIETWGQHRLPARGTDQEGRLPPRSARAHTGAHR